jgi:phosphoglycolate phosphatase-like HAD superfamily hydrolase
MNQSSVYALDFDGVICDSAVETAITGWKVASAVWDDMPNTAPQAIIDRFRLVRPILETGYEAILAMRLLYLDVPVEAIYSDYNNKIKKLLQDKNINANDLKKLFGEARDAWIANDLADWIAMNPLFAGVKAKLQKLGQQHSWYVVTTKQERFVKHILKANAIDLADERIFGMDSNMNKLEVLKNLLNNHPNETLYFVEDRLPTLLKVLKDNELASIKLIFASWGYNTTEEKGLVAEQAITSQKLEDFLEI